MSGIQTILMPKWGLAMQEGLLAAWHVEAGQTISKGQEIADIETSKIANVYESLVTGPLRRRLVEAGEVVQVGALLGVVAEADVSDAEIDAFVTTFQAEFALNAAAASQKAPEPSTVDVGGRAIRFLELGGEREGDPYILLHGFGGDLENFLFNQAELAQDRRALALDLPGHGGSSKDVGGGDVASLAAAVAAFMDVKGIGAAHLVGHSLGAAVGLALALDKPARVASLSLICPAGLGPDIEMAYIEGFLGTSRARKLKPILEMLVADPNLVTNDMVEGVLRMKRLDGAEAALRKVADAVFPGGKQGVVMADRLASLSCPIQVIWGEQDRIVPAAHGKALPPTVKVTILPATGHLAHMERAAEVNAAIRGLAGAA